GVAGVGAKQRLRVKRWKFLAQQPSCLQQWLAAKLLFAKVSLFVSTLESGQRINAMLLPESQSLKGLPPLTKSSYHSAPLRSETRVHGKSSGLLVARVARVGAAAPSASEPLGR